MEIYYTFNAIAGKLGIHPSTLYKWVNRYDKEDWPEPDIIVNTGKRTVPAYSEAKIEKWAEWARITTIRA